MNIENPKTYIAICKTHGGENTVRWLKNCIDFWDAVEKAKTLLEVPAELPAAPVKQGDFDHLYGGNLHGWKKECTTIKINNNRLIKEVLEIKRFMA